MRQKREPRHFVEVATTGEVRKAIGAVYVPCDDKPSYWRRTPSGDVIEMTRTEAARIKRLIGPPQPTLRPASRPQGNPLRPPPMPEF